MKTDFIIGIKFEGNLNHYYQDSDGLRKPFFFHLPYSPNIRENFVDFKALGCLYYLCNAIAGKDEDPILLYCIITDHKENHEGWVEMQDTKEGYIVYNLQGYEGEGKEGKIKPFLNLQYLYNIPNPKYIYLKKI